MPAELPTIASCPHCGTILLQTPRVLVHPMSGEREQIRRTLGESWVEHAHTLFDGRIHHCPGRRRGLAVTALASSSCPGANGRTYLLAMAVAAGLLAGAPSIAQEESGTWYLAPGEPAPYRQNSRGGGLRSPLGSLSLLDETTNSGTAEPRFAPPRRPVEPELLSRQPGLDVAAGSHLSGEGDAPEVRARSWRGVELASGRYQVVDTIREDVAGVVYLAHDRNLDSHVDVEVPTLSREQKPGATVQFVRAVRSLARLGHPHLAKVTEVGTYREAPFVVAEHLAGGSLRFRRPVGADGQPLPVAPGSLAEWLTDVASALDYLHSQGRVYLEVSPANVLFDAQGRAYLGGLAMSEAVAKRIKPVPDSGPAALCECRGPAVTLAPEIMNGTKPDGRADQYALAATVYELLCGQPPFAGQTLAGIAVRQSTSEVPDLPERNAAISRSLSSAVMRGLSRDPQERYVDCSAFARAVLAAAREPAPVRKPAVVAAARVAQSASPRHSKLGTLGGAGRGTVTMPQLLALGLVASMLVAALGVKARRRPGRKRGASAPARPRQVAGKRLRRLYALAGRAAGERHSPPAKSPRPGEPNPMHTPMAGPSRSPRDDFHLPAQAVGEAFARLRELDARPRTHLGHNLLPVPYLSAAPPAPERRPRAAAAESDQVASRQAS